MGNSVLSERPGPAPSERRAPSSLPDINAETHPFSLVQEAIDRAAYFNWLSVLIGGASSSAIRRDGAVIGF